MTDDADTLQDRRQLNPNADLVGIDLIEHEGFELELPQSTIGAEYMWNDGPVDEPLSPDVFLPIPPRVAVDTPEYVAERRVCNRWIYAVTRDDAGAMFLRYELRADQYGRLRWLDATAFRELRETNPGVDDEDDAAYLERGFSGGDDKTLWLSTIAVANSGVAWHFFGVGQRLPLAAVEKLVSSYELWSPDRGLAAWQLEPRTGRPSQQQQPRGPHRVARVFDPVVETRRCTEAFIGRRDRYLEYAIPMHDSEYWKTSTQRHVVKRIANACRALLDQDPDLDPADVVSAHWRTWPSVSDLCFTPFEQDLVAGVDDHTNGVDGFLEAEQIVWTHYWNRAERAATALRLWLSSAPWEFVQHWTLERFERDPQPGHWMLATLARAFQRLDELVTGRQYLAWLTRRVVDGSFRDPTPNVELMRVMLLPELSAAPGPDPIKMARGVPKAAFDLLVTGHRFIFGLPIDELRVHLGPLLPDHVAAGKFGKALETFRMSADRRLFCNCVGRMMERMQEVAKVEVAGLFDHIDDLNMAIDVPSGPGAGFRTMRFRLRLDTVGNLAEDLLNVEQELADSFNTTPSKSWFSGRIQRLTSNHVGGVFAIMDILINAREVWLACRDENGTPSAAFKSAAAFLRSVYSYGPIKAAVDGARPSPGTQALSKLHTVGPQDPRWVRRVTGSITRRVGASLVGYLLSSIMLGYALHDVIEKREEGTDEELLISSLVVVAEGASLASAFLLALHLGRAGAVGALIGLVVGLAVFVVQAFQPGEPEIGIRTCIFGREYVGRDQSLNHNARPWQACRENSLLYFVPGGAGQNNTYEGLMTQLFAMTSLMHNFRMRLRTVDDHPLAVRIELQPGFVPRDARFDLRIELEWIVGRRSTPMSFELDTVSHVYTLSLYPDERSMPFDSGKPDIEASAGGVTEPGRLLVLREDVNGIALVVDPLDGYAARWTGMIATDVHNVQLRERYRVRYELDGSGEGRRLLVRVEYQEALGYISDLLELGLDFQLELDGVRIDVHRVAASDSDVFAFPLPESEGELVPGSGVLLPRYAVQLPSQEAHVEGAPRPLGDEEHAETWPVGGLDAPLLIELPYKAWLGHDGHRPQVGFAPEKAWVSNLLTGGDRTEMYVPLRQVRLEYKRNEGLGYPHWEHEPATDDGFAVLPLLRRFNGDFEVDAEKAAWPPANNAIRDTDQLTHRFALGFPEGNGTRWSAPKEPRGPEDIAKTHGSPALDAKLAKREILWRARVEARLVLGDELVIGAMPCNLASDDPVWLEQTLQAVIDWKPGNVPTPGTTKPTLFGKAIDVCVPPP